ncbi:hypothetical protein FMN50_02035 [Rhodobacterales bacterium]|nr:hypothetical protein FMN50_02035 [Rhodobacterales bacterium]
MTVTVFPFRPKSPKPAEPRTWWAPVNFVFDDGTELSLPLAEKVIHFLEKHLWAEESKKHFIIVETFEEIVAINVRRLSHWTPDMEELGLLETVERREEDEDEPAPVSVHCANLAEPIQLWCAAEEASADIKPVQTAMLDLDDADLQDRPFLKVLDSSLQPHFFRTASVLLFRVPTWIVPDVLD